MRGRERFSLIQAHHPSEEIISRLRGISNLDSLKIDTSRSLGFKKGDLNLVHSRTVRCTLKDSPAPRLVLTRLECLDQTVYNLKVHELDLLSRFSHHPNIVSLYSYWSEPSKDPFTHKILYLLTEEAIVGDLHKTIEINPLKPSTKTIMKYICDLAKGLSIMHQSGTVHGGVRSTNLFISGDNQLVLGRPKKSDLESLRKTRHLLSKFCIERYLKIYFIYWAPEVATDQAIGRPADIWALGVLVYLLITGKYPFDPSNHDQTLSNILNININYRLLLNHLRVTYMLKRIFVAEPEQRWTALQVLHFCQEDFAIVIQRFWRGCSTRLAFRNKCAALLRIQAAIRGWLVRKRYNRRKFELRWQAALSIQRLFRNHKTSGFYRKTRKSVHRMQANVLTRQMRRAFLNLKKDTITAQA